MNLRMTNSKVRNSDSAYSICFSQVLLKLFTFLINTADKEIYKQDKQTNTQTHINRVLIILRLLGELSDVLFYEN